MKIVGMFATLFITCLIIMFSFQFAGCSRGNNVHGSTAAGAVLGGVIGGAIFGPDSGAGIVGGALLGGIIGNGIGSYMDQQDEKHAFRSYTTGSSSTWVNYNTGYTFVITKVKKYRKNSKECIKYLTKVYANGNEYHSYGVACKNKHDEWTSYW